MIDRIWQASCLQTMLTHFKAFKSFFLRATPGAGKTYLSARLAQVQFKLGRIDFVVFVSPMASISNSAKETFERVLGGRFDGSFGSKGICLTYQDKNFLERDDIEDLMANHRVLLVTDEVHHLSGNKAGQCNGWAEKMLPIIERAVFVLSMSGTPWRTDEKVITNARYNDDEIAVDFEYTLEEAIKDEVCKIPHFMYYDLENIRFKDQQLDQHYDDITDLLSSKLISYTHLLKEKELLIAMLTDANNHLNKLRSTVHNAAGLVVAIDGDHADIIKSLLLVITNQPVEIVKSADRDSQNKIRQFRTSSVKWIVSIAQISEGTDIPRLQVAVYVTNAVTKLKFEQSSGRAIRYNQDFLDAQQCAWVYTPAHPDLLEYGNLLSGQIPEQKIIHSPTFKKNKPRKVNAKDPSRVNSKYDEQITALLDFGIEHNEQLTTERIDLTNEIYLDYACNTLVDHELYYQIRKTALSNFQKHATLMEP